MASVNVELKAVDRDPEATETRCLALGAAPTGVSSMQRDTYFRGPARPPQAARRGRSRRWRTDRVPPAGSTPMPTESTYVLAPVAAADELAEALDAALGTVVVVSKRRRLLLWEGVRIHLDEVEELGNFIEFEAVLPDAGDLATAHEKVAHLRSELGIADDDAGRGRLRGPADGRAAGAAARRFRGDARMPTPRIRSSRSAPRCGRRAARSTPARTSRTSRTPRASVRRPRRSARLVAAGETAITAVAVVAERLEVCPPCGGCRQRLSEFGDASTPVYLGPTSDDLGRAVARRVRPRGAGLNLGTPRVGVVLGSGLGAVADAVEDPVVVGYEELPGFPRPSVEGHAGRAVLGSIGGVPVAVLQGRAHLYEGGDPEALRDAGARAARGRRRDPGPHERRRVAAPGGRAGVADGDHRSHQHDGREPARRAERRGDRAAVSVAARRL